MKKIGLTGIIGSGKTTAALYFKGLGVPVFIADDCAKELMENDDNLKNKTETKGSVFLGMHRFQLFTPNPQQLQYR